MFDAQNHETNGMYAQGLIRSWQDQYITQCSEAKTREYREFIQDCMLYTRFAEMSARSLGELMEKATAKRLTSMGYPGARSNDGTSLSPLFTVVLNKIALEFGEKAVKRSTKDLSNHAYSWRGIRNTMTIKQRYVETMDRIMLELMVA